MCETQSFCLLEGLWWKAGVGAVWPGRQGWRRAGCQSCLVRQARRKEKNWGWCSLGACLLPERPIAICSAVPNITSQTRLGRCCM